MFESIGDLPLHPLVIHAAVLGVPVTLLLSLLFAVPRTRGWARWPLPIAAVGSTAAVFLARESGEALAGALGLGEPVASLIMEHARLAGQLQLLTAALAVLAVVAALVVGRRGGSAQRPAHRGRDAVLLVLLVGLAAVSAFWVYRVGDLGARAVWNPTGAASSTANR